MNTPSSEWSSGCESGWTDYFDESLESPNQYPIRGVCDHLTSCKPLSYEDEEDLSMVSDASSGPPHSHYYHYYEQEEEAKGVIEWSRKDGFSSSKTNKVKETRGKRQDLCLDDTASSPVFSCPKSCVDSSSNQQSISHGWNTKRLDSAEPSGGRKRK